MRKHISYGITYPNSISYCTTSWQYEQKSYYIAILTIYIIYCHTIANTDCPRGDFRKRPGLSSLTSATIMPRL